MLFLAIVIGWIFLRSVASWLFYTIGIAFILFLILGIYASIQNREFSWTEALYAVGFILLTLWLMFG